MKVAITVADSGPEAQVDPRFGRARWFRIVDTETGQVETVDNTPNLQAAQGAGIQAARRCVELGIEAVITGQVGPKAFAVRQGQGVAVHTGASGLADEALERFTRGQLPATGAATVEGHWS
ncbi:MAG: NifB/NifX family molybdenum-iron cluster-binding protein [Planctomycetota bacterium]